MGMRPSGRQIRRQLSQFEGRDEALVSTGRVSYARCVPMSKRRPHAPRNPLRVQGGIRAQSRRGALAHTWWGRRWLLALERLRLGARLGRGRNYAQSGQVSALAYDAGCLTAIVQGSHPQPYRVEVHLRQLEGAARQAVEVTLRNQPLLLARLLVRDLPHAVETLFHEAATPLFPEPTGDLHTRCTCPDWSQLCKHVAAVYLLFGEALDRDPTLLLTLRGLRLREILGDARAPAVPCAGNPLMTPAPTVAAAAPGKVLPADFWGDHAPAPYADFGAAPAAGAKAPLLHRLGPLPFWRGQEHFMETVATAGGRAAPTGWRIWAGEPLPARLCPVPATSRSPRLRRSPLRMDLTAR